MKQAESFNLGIVLIAPPPNLSRLVLMERGQFFQSPKIF